MEHSESRTVFDSVASAVPTEWLREAPGFVAIFTGPELVFEFVNDECCRLVGRRREDLIGKPVIEALHEMRGQPFEQQLQAVASARQPFQGRGLKLRLGADPEHQHEHYLDLYYRPFYSPEGRFQGAFVQGHDATELYLRNAELKRFDVNRDAFLARLAHELRNPLGSVANAVRVLQDHPECQTPLLQRLSTIMSTQVTDTLALVDELYDLAAVKLGKMPLRITPGASLQVLVRDAAVAARAQLERKDQALSVLLPAKTLCIDADTTKLRRVIANLIGNASKYTPVQGRIEVSLACNEGEALVRVRDDGIGMTPETMSRIFDLYFQEAERPGGGVGPGGLGIGLSLARQVAELHGGTLNAYSDGPGRGSTFTLRLPCRQQ